MLLSGTSAELRCAENSDCKCGESAETCDLTISSWISDILSWSAVILCFIRWRLIDPAVILVLSSSRQALIMLCPNWQKNRRFLVIERNCWVIGVPLSRSESLWAASLANQIGGDYYGTPRAHKFQQATRVPACHVRTSHARNPATCTSRAFLAMVLK